MDKQDYSEGQKKPADPLSLENRLKPYTNAAKKEIKEGFAKLRRAVKQFWEWVIADAKKVRKENIKFCIEIGTFIIAARLLFIYQGQLDAMNGTLTQMEGTSRQTTALIIVDANQVAAMRKLADNAGKQNENLANLVAEARKGANAQTEAIKPIMVFNDIVIRHSEEKVWAVIRIQNNGATEAQTVKVAARLKFGIQRADDGKFIDSDFRFVDPRRLRPFKASGDVADVTDFEIFLMKYSNYKSQRFYIFVKISYQDAAGEERFEGPVCKFTGVGNDLFSVPPGYGVPEFSQKNKRLKNCKNYSQ